MNLKKFYRFQGMATVDVIGALILPLILYFVAINYLYYYMKSNNINEISDWIVYAIFIVGAAPTFLIMGNFFLGVAIDYKKGKITFPVFLIFRGSIFFNEIENWSKKDKKYTRVSQFRPTMKDFFKYFAICKMKNEKKEKVIIFRNQKIRNEFLKNIQKIKEKK
jgi:hypothetical protein